MTEEAQLNALAAEMAHYYDDPLGYVQDCFPWGEGELAHDPGPDEWQTQFLKDLGDEVRTRKFDGYNPVEAVRMAVASGHGIGKGVVIALVACWIMDTRENSQGTVTANTFPQLSSKTWPTICRWRGLSLTSKWWSVTGDTIYHSESKNKFGVPQWFLRCQSSAEENNEAFAGQHKKDSSSYYLFDEASAIPAKIWEKADGGLTDGEPFFFAFGNPTRNTGEFFEVCFGDKRHRWNVRSIDSRTSRFTNKLEIDKMIEDYGIDSDRVRYQILGLPPAQAEGQFIGQDLTRAAMQRTVKPLEDEPLVCGVDVADGGGAWFIVRFRRGFDGNPVAPIRIPGSKCDRPMMIATLAKLLREGTICADGKRRYVSMMFVDSAFGSPVVERLHTLGFETVQEVNFGGRSPDIHQENMRAYMWQKMKDWLDKGCFDRNDKKLEKDLTSPGWHFNRSNKLVLESKEDMRNDKANPRPSPDDGDALALTFAAPVAPVGSDHEYEGRPQRHWAA
jgi:hypothetical protein